MSTDELSNEKAAELIKDGNREYIPYLWERVNKLLYSLAYKYYTKYYNRFICCGVTDEDLKQECFIIMLNMVYAYDPEKEYKFTTYADFQFKRCLRSLLRIGGNIAEEPLNACTSFFEPITGAEDKALTIGDSLKDEAAELAYSNSENAIFREQLHGVLENIMNKVLTKEQIQALTERYYNNRSLLEVCEIIGCSMYQARTFEKMGLLRLWNYNNTTKSLEPFKDEIISRRAYRANGVQSFKNNQASSVELISEKLFQLFGE